MSNSSILTSNGGCSSCLTKSYSIAFQLSPISLSHPWFAVKSIKMLGTIKSLPNFGWNLKISCKNNVKYFNKKNLFVEQNFLDSYPLPGHTPEKLTAVRTPKSWLWKFGFSGLRATFSRGLGVYIAAWDFFKGMEISSSPRCLKNRSRCSPWWPHMWVIKGHI